MTNGNPEPQAARLLWWTLATLMTLVCAFGLGLYVVLTERVAGLERRVERDESLIFELRRQHERHEPTPKQED